MKRTFLIAGNWKMNAGPAEAASLSKEMAGMWSGKTIKSEPLICPPFVSIAAVREGFIGSSFKVGAQNVSTQDNGAYTGEISTSMLKDSGCEYVIIGHSERREYYHEDNDLVAEKAKKVIDDGLNAIVCVGEILAERKSGVHEKVVKEQIQAVLNKLGKAAVPSLVIAYEPVWAIGTGETASPDQAQEMHAFIRSLLSEHFGDDAAQTIRILYGGSMNPGNADELLSQKDVDGGLIGGASLKADSFSQIISIAESL